MDNTTNSAQNGAPKDAKTAPKAHKLDKHNPWKKVIILAVILLIVLLVTNPSLMFFLPAAWRESMKNAYNSLFGDVDQITKVLDIKWVRIFKVIVIVLFMLIVKSVLKIVMEKIKPKTPKGASIHSMVKSFSGYAVALIMLIWCLSAIGINLSTIFASIGIVALVIGFAAESLIEDVVTGLFLVFEDEFNVGDIIEYNGFRGTVTNIGVRVTSIQDPGGNIKLVNNSDLRNIMNRSRTSSNAAASSSILSCPTPLIFRSGCSSLYSRMCLSSVRQSLLTSSATEPKASTSRRAVSITLHPAAPVRSRIARSASGFNSEGETASRSCSRGFTLSDSCLKSLAIQIPLLCAPAPIIGRRHNMVDLIHMTIDCFCPSIDLRL